MYLVTGATGHIGGTLTQLLLDRGHAVRALVRDPARAAGLPAGAEITVGDLDDADSVRRAATGAEGIFHLQASHGTSQTAIMIEAARAAGAGRIVALSSIGAVLHPMPVMGSWFHAREELLRASGLDVTYLRPNTLMSNALWWAPSIRKDGQVTDAAGPGPVSCVDTDDIARVAAAALTEPGHAGHGYVLTGPQALTSREQAGILAGVLGRPVTLTDTTPAALADASVAAGTPREAADALAELNQLFRDGRAGLVTDDVANVTGQPAGTFRAWCERNAAAFT